MEVIAEIRRRHLVSKESISSIARDLKLSRPTVRKHLQTEADAVYIRQNQPAPKLGEFQAALEGWLQTERHLPKAQRRTARRLFEGLQAEGYRGAYDSVQRFVKQWKAGQAGPTIKQAFVPLAFAPGEVGQFDWSHEHVEIDGVMQTIKVAHFRLAYSLHFPAQSGHRVHCKLETNSTAKWTLIPRETGQDKPSEADADNRGILDDFVGGAHGQHEVIHASHQGSTQALFRAEA